MNYIHIYQTYLNHNFNMRFATVWSKGMTIDVKMLRIYNSYNFIFHIIIIWKILGG